MKANVVLFERTIRFGLGLLLLASPLLEVHTYPFNLLGVVLLVTGASGFCPLYGIFSAGPGKYSSAAKLRLVPKAVNENLQAHSRSH